MTYYKKGRDNHDVMAAASPFLEFNEWLKTKPAQWHKEIFEIYKDIKKSILEINDVNRLIGVLNKHFIKIYAKVNLDEMKHWITLLIRQCMFQIKRKLTTTHKQLMSIKTI